MRLTFPGLFLRALPLVALMLFFYGKWGHLQYGIFYDPDGYVRLMRVQQFEDTHHWYFDKFHRSNAPEGESNHWSRPLDWMLWIGAKIGSPVFGFQKSLEYFGIIFSPLLFLHIPAALYWMARPWLSYHQRDFLILCTVGSIDFLLPYFFGRPDHHCLLSLLAILVTGVAIRIYEKPSQRFWWFVQGILFTFSLWISVESLLLLGVFMTPFLVTWLREEKSFTSGLSLFWKTLTLGTLFIILVETPLRQLLLLKEYDKISSVHFRLFLSLTIYFSWIEEKEKKGDWFSFTEKIGFSLFPALYVLIVIPDFIKGPMTGIPERAFPIWLNNIGEVQPLWGPTAYSMFKMAGHLVLLGLAIGGYQFLSKRSHIKGAPFCLLGAIVFTLVGFFQVRWLSYSPIFIFPLAIPLLDHWIQINYSNTQSWNYRACKILIAVSLWVLMATGSLIDDGKNAFKTNPATGNGESVDLEVRTFSQWLKKQSFEKTPRIMTHLDYGPEILYYSQAEVIGTGYHRNWSGILDSYDFFHSADDSVSFELAKKRGITHVLVTKASFEKDYFKGEKGSPSLHEKLLQEMPPAWLKRSSLKLPQSIEKSLLLYEFIQN